jgi:hypothetical protein
MESLQIDPRVQGWWRTLRLDSCADITRFFLPETPLAKSVVVTPRTVGGREVFFRRRQIKDLALLDKMASQHCTRGERGLFLKTDGGDRQLATDLLTYRKRRWLNE